MKNELLIAFAGNRSREVLVEQERMIYFTAGECIRCGGSGIIPAPDMCECDWSGCGCIERPCQHCNRKSIMRRLHKLRMDIGAGIPSDLDGLLERIDDIIAARDI